MLRASFYYEVFLCIYFFQPRIARDNVWGLWVKNQNGCSKIRSTLFYPRHEKVITAVRSHNTNVIYKNVYQWYPCTIYKQEQITRAKWATRTMCNYVNLSENVQQSRGRQSCESQSDEVLNSVGLLDDQYWNGTSVRTLMNSQHPDTDE